MDGARRAPRPDLAQAAFAAVWFLVGIGVVIGSAGYVDPAGRFPTLIGAGVAALAAFRVVAELRGSDTVSERPPAARADLIRAAMFIGSIVILGVLIVVLGMLVGGVIWATGVLVGIYRWHPLKSAAIAIVIVAVVGVAFTALGLDLPTGLLDLPTGLLGGVLS